jgi:hypothetical protein
VKNRISSGSALLADQEISCRPTLGLSTMRGNRTGLFGSLEDTRAIAVVCDRRRVAIGSRQPSARLERIVHGRNLDDKAAHFAIQSGVSGMRLNGETASHYISAIQSEKLTQCVRREGHFPMPDEAARKVGHSLPAHTFSRQHGDAAFGTNCVALAESGTGAPTGIEFGANQGVDSAGNLWLCSVDPSESSF